jgi:hypothetical protein
MEKTGKKQKPRWKKALTIGIVVLAFIIVVDGFVVYRAAYRHYAISQAIGSFTDKVFALRQAYRERDANKVADTSVSHLQRRKDEPVTTISLVGLDKEEIIQPLKMPDGFLPTTVNIYDTEQLIGSKGYLLEWDQWGAKRSGLYPRRWSLTVETAKLNYRLSGFGVDGGVFVSNVAATATSKLAEEFSRPLHTFERMFRVRYSCPESLRGKVSWAVFETDALWQKHCYDEQGKYQSSEGWFSGREATGKARLLLWDSNRLIRVSPSSVTKNSSVE